MQSIQEFIVTHSVKGFLAHDEGAALFAFTKEVAHLGPCLEVGSYCGKSTVYMGEGCRKTHNTLFAVDHHRGSEEHQLGEEYHDAELFDKTAMRINSFPTFQKNIALAHLEGTVIPIVAASDDVVKHWSTPLGMVFIDGGHSPEMSIRDCLNWAAKLTSGGILAVHDIFPSPADGGQGPFLGLQAVIETGDFELLPQINTLGFARKF